MSKSRSRQENVAVQESHYDRKYSETDTWALRISAADRFEGEFERFRRWNVLSYGSFFFDEFHRRLDGKKVLELGFGKGDLSLLMARFGATVVGVEVSDAAVTALNKMAATSGLSSRVSAIKNSDLDSPRVEAGTFDFVIGKAFLHHLTHEEEADCLTRVVRLLKSTGEARFFEPAENSAVLDKFRWVVPVNSRPSVLNPGAFAAWEYNDPHPRRDNSARHYHATLTKHFRDVQIVPKEALQRLSRLFPNDSFCYRRTKRALQTVEEWLPRWVHRRIARAQVIVCTRPIQ